jgi:hypothetical protein
MGQTQTTKRVASVEELKGYLLGGSERVNFPMSDCEITGAELDCLQYSFVKCSFMDINLIELVITGQTMSYKCGMKEKWIVCGRQTLVNFFKAALLAFNEKSRSLWHGAQPIVINVDYVLFATEYGCEQIKEALAFLNQECNCRIQIEPRVQL